MKDKIDIDEVLDTIDEINEFLKIIRKCADKAKTYSCDAKVADLEILSRSLKNIEDAINNNKKVIGMLPLGSFYTDLDSNNKILKIMKEVR